MKDFDTARRMREQADRSFVLGGHTFTYKASVAPEAILTWNEAVAGEADGLTERAWLDLFDETVVAILDPGQQEAWEAVRDPAGANPVNLADLREVLTWLIEKATGRPTGEPSGSSPGSGSTETPLKVASSPTAVPSAA